jgi:hypothetical protein
VNKLFVCTLTVCSFQYNTCFCVSGNLFVVERKGKLGRSEDGIYRDVLMFVNKGLWCEKEWTQALKSRWVTFMRLL